MKRLSIAAGLALLAHGLFFCLSADWLRVREANPGRTEPVSLSLEYLIHEKSEEPVRYPFIDKALRETWKAPPKETAPEPENRVDFSPEKKTPAPISGKRIAPKAISEPVKINETMPDAEGEITSEKEPEPGHDLPRPEEIHTMKEEEREDGKPEVIPPDRTTIREAIPVYKDNPEPLYPKTARRRGIEGSVVLDVFVGSEGMVKEVRVSESSGHSMLDSAAMEAVEKWVFIPAMKGDKAVEMWVKVPIRFRLE